MKIDTEDNLNKQLWMQLSRQLSGQLDDQLWMQLDGQLWRRQFNNQIMNELNETSID